MESKREFVVDSVPLCYPDFIKLDYPGVLRDVSSVSHAIFGQFIQSPKTTEQLAILRGLETIELYTLTKEKLQLVTKYHMPNIKCIDMVAARLPFRDSDKQVLLLHMPKLKVSDNL